MIKKTLSLVALVAISFCGMAQPKFADYQYDLSYFLPHTIQLNKADVALAGNYNNAIPTPKQVLGFELGEQYCDWGDVLRYVEAVDQASDRISVRKIGRTHERRTMVEVTITSPANHANIERIKADHLRLTDAAHSAEVDIKQMPLVADITCSIHGNEVSGVHSALAMLYMFAASEDEAVKQMLDNMVLLLVPGSNPDGIHRFASWSNSASGEFLVCDNKAYEHNEPWPGSRINHYWADLNRDLLMCRHPEGRALVGHYLNWHPNLVLDLHEQRNGDFFHSPGHPLRVHPYVTDENQSLTGKVGAYVSKALEPIGANPYSGRSFDDLYIGKGAAYGDVQGSVCLLYEHPNTRTHIFTYKDKVRTFTESIRSQAHAAIAGLCAGVDMRETLLAYQRDFYRKSATAAEESAVKGFIFSAGGDDARAFHLLDNLATHQIEVYHLAKDTKVGKSVFAADNSYVIPLKQKYFYKLKTMWERLAISDYKDDTFYDISTWTYPLAYNVSHAELSATDGLLGKRAEAQFPKGCVVGGKSDKAYIIDGSALYSHNILRALLKAGVKVDIATQPFKAAGKKMGHGDCIVKVEGQSLSGDALYELLDKAATENGVEVYADNKFKGEKVTSAEARMPKVALMVGDGVNTHNTGEIWQMLEQQFGIAPVRLRLSSFDGKELSRFNTIIISKATLSSKHKALESLHKWVEEGGTLITIDQAYRLPNRAELTAIKQVESDNKETKGKISGAILATTIDTTTPLGYGYTNGFLPLLKTSNIVYDEAATAPTIVPVRYEAQPYLSGYIKQSQLDMIASTPAAFVVKRGEGCVVHFADNLTFRGYWYGATKLFMNAIYFGHLY